MKRLFAAVVIVLVASSSVSAGWTYVAPMGVPVYSPVGYEYYAARPVYMYQMPVVADPLVVAPNTVVYPAPVIIRTKVFVPGQPVRNVLRALSW